MFNNIKILLILMIITAVAVFFVLKDESLHGSHQLDWLVPELQKNVNQIDKILITKKGNAMTLVKVENAWRINNDAGFYANRENIAAVLMDLRSAQKLEKKTSNPDNFERLDLAENATQIDLFSGAQLIKSIKIGKNSSASQGSFVRQANENQAWLVTAIAPITVSVEQWLQKKLFDINAERVQSVEIKSAQSETTVKIVRTPSRGSFVLDSLPEGETLAENANLSQLANGLANYVIDAALAKNTESLQQVKTVDYGLSNGLLYQFEIYIDDSDYLMTVSFNTVAGADLTSEVEQEMARLNKRFNGWMFKIPSYKFEAIDVKLSQYLSSKVE